MAGKGVQLGFLKYVLGFDTLQFKKGISDADADLAKMQKRFAAKGKEFQALGKSLTAFVTLPLAGLAAAGIKEAQETASAMAQVNASLASMGPVAGRSADQLKRMSDALETKSLFEGDQILKDVTATMLTFGSVTGKTFDAAQQAAVDLATKFGKGLPEAAVMIGKALNDPIKGLTALQRVGVQFTAQQREQIKAMVEAGNVAGAQAVILGELKREVGGAAEAAQNADPWNKLSDAFKSIAESIGTLLLPIIPPLANALASVAQWVSSLDPTTQKWVIGIVAAVAALGPLLIVVGNVVLAVSRLGPLVLALSRGWGLLTAGLTALAPVIGIVGRALLGLLANPVLLGAAVVITGIYLAWKNWDKIAPIIQGIYTAVKTWLLDKLQAVAGFVRSKVIEPVANAFKWLQDVVVGHSYVPDMVDAIAATMARLDTAMVAPAKDATSKTAEAFRELQSNVSQLLDRLYPEAARQNALATDIRTLDDAMKAGIVTSSQWLDAMDKVTGAFQVSPDLLNPIPLDKVQTDLDAFVAANDNAVERAKTPFQQWADTIPQTAEEISTAFQGIAAHGVDDFSRAITDVITGARSLKDAFGDVAKSIIADLIQMAVRMLIFRALASAFPGLFKDGGAAGGFGGFRANGGPVVPGKSYVVGENGPEYVSFGSRGHVTPANDAAAGAVTVNNYNTLNTQGNAATREDLQRMGVIVQASTMKAIQEKRRRSRG